MQAFRESTIRCKLVSILMLTSSAALVAAGLAFGVYDAVTFRHAMARDLASLAEIIGQNAASSLASGDRGAAAQVLSTLRAKPNVMAARAYAKGGEIVAEYYHGNVPIPLPPECCRGSKESPVPTVWPCSTPSPATGM